MNTIYKELNNKLRSALLEDLFMNSLFAELENLKKTELFL